MGQLKTELINKLKGLAPFEQIVRLYENPADFSAELNNYFVGGVVISTPTMFAMGKPIDSSIDPSGQWYAENPDAWYVKWFAGEDALQAIMDIVQPLPKVVFSRIKNGRKSADKTYAWDKLYNLVSRRK
jgi:hypothetical protein